MMVSAMWVWFAVYGWGLTLFALWWVVWRQDRERRRIRKRMALAHFGLGGIEDESD